ncbi:MAG: hypothetical protein ACJAUH_001074 [Saprospiraceae bacterium]|jgi:hypothetical protein
MVYGIEQKLIHVIYLIDNYPIEKFETNFEPKIYSKPFIFTIQSIIHQNRKAWIN